MDDNSNQATVQIIKSYLSDSRIQYINSNIKDSERYKTTRYATLINSAIPKTKGKYISYLTDDNIYLPERFEAMLKVFDHNPAIEIVYSQQLVKYLDDNGNVQQQFLRKARRILKNPVGLVDHCSVMHTRNIAEKVFEKHGSYWDDHPVNWFNGDAAFWQRLAHFQPFFPIRKTLDIAFKGHDSFQRLYTLLPKVIPNGTIIKGPTTDIYLIDKQERRKISTDLFGELKYTVEQVVIIPDPFVYKYKEGALIDQEIYRNISLLPNERLIKSPQDSEVYFIQGHQKRLFIDEHVFKEYKFKKEDIVHVPEYLIKKIPVGKPIKGFSNRDESLLPDGVLFLGENSYYLSYNNHLHPIAKDVASKLKLPINNAVKINKSILFKYTIGTPYN